MKTNDPSMPETMRMQELLAYDILDTSEEAEYDFLTELAASCCDSEMALISFSMPDKEWYKSRHGLEIREIPARFSFVGHVIEASSPRFFIEDASKDKRFKNNPLVRSNPHVRFYAGVPLVTPSGIGIGALSVSDRIPKKLSEKQWNHLEGLAGQILQLLELRRLRRTPEDGQQIRDKSVLRKTEKHFKTLVENGADAIAILGHDGKPTYVSPSIKKVLGYTEEEALNLNLFEVVHPEDVPALEKKMHEVLQQPGIPIQGLTSRTRHKDGSWRWLEATITNMLHDPQINGIVDNFRDVTQRMEALQELQRSEEKYRTLFNSSPLPMLIYDMESYQILDVNQSACLHYGYSYKEFLKLTFPQLSPKKEARTVIATIKDLGNHKGIIRFGLFTHQKKDGNSMLMETSGQKLEYNGQDCITVVCTDVTDKTKVQESLHRERNLLRTLIDNIPDYVYIKDLKSRHLINNKANVRLMGALSEEETLGKTAMEFFDPVLAKSYIADDQRVIKTGRAVLNREEEIFSKTQEKKWLLTSKIPLRDTNGTIFGLVGISYDITQKKEREQRLMLMSSVVTNTHDAVMITEAEPHEEPGPRIIYVNEAFTRMTGYSAREVVGRSPRMLQGPKSDRTELKKLGAAMRRWESCEITTINYKKNGDPFWIHLTISPVADEKGWYTHWIAIERDVTLQKIQELEKQLLSDIGDVFNREERLKDCLDATCKFVAAIGNFDLVEIWLPNQDGTKLNLGAKHTNNESGAIFYARTKEEVEFNYGEGLPGGVWKQMQADTWFKIDQKKAFAGKEDVQASGHATAYGVPLVHNQELMGVLVLGAAHLTSWLSFYGDLFKKLETAIGAEIKRKKLENELNQLFNFAPDLIAIADFDGFFKKMNPAGLDMLGYQYEDIIARPYLDFIHPEDREKTCRIVQDLRKGGPTLHFENRVLTKEGGYKWMNWTASPSTDEKIVYAVGKDVSDSKELEELLLDATELARIGSWEIDLLTNDVYWSAITCDIHETEKRYQPDFESAINFYKDIHREQVKTYLKRCIETGQPFDFEAQLITAKDHERWVRVIGKAEFQNGSCSRVYGSFQDIHHRKEAELRIKNISDNLPGVLFQYCLYPDGSDALSYVSKGSLQIWGLTPEECIADVQRVWSQIEKGGSMEKVMHTITASAASLTKWNVEMRNIMPDGKIIWLEGHGIPRKMPDGTIIWDSMILDISEKKELRELLTNTNQLARIGSWEINLEKNKVFWSEITKELHEVSPEFEPDMAVLINFFKEGKSRNYMERGLNEAIANGTSIDLEVKLVTATSRERWVKIIGQADFHEGRCRRVFGSMQDIHERKDIELRLLRMADNLPGVIFQYHLHPDGSDGLRYVSSRSEEIWGLSPETCMADNDLVWKQIEAGGGLKKLLATIAASGETLQGWTSKWKSVLPSGDVRWHEGFGAPYKMADGTLVWDSLILDITEEKELELLLERATKMARIGSWELDLRNKDSEVMYWSPMTRMILEVGASYNPTLTGGFELYEAKSKQLITRAVDKLIARGSKFDLELLLTTAKGNPRWVRCIGQSEWIDGTCTKIFGSFQDIHQRKVAELALKDAFEEKTRILESIGDGFFALDKAWTVTYWNHQAENILGRKREAVLGKNLWEVYPETVGSEFQIQYREAIKSGKSRNFESYYPELEMWIEVSAFPSDNGLSVYFKDVTDRRGAEERIRLSNERFEKVAEATSDAIWDWDIANDLLYWGEGYKKLFGHEVEKITPTLKTWTDLIHPEDLQRVLMHFREAVDNPATTQFLQEYRFMKADKSYAFIIDRGLILRDQNRKGIRMVGAMTDITYRKTHENSLKNLNAQLQQRAHQLELSNAELEQFAFVASHDLQEPLRMVTSFLYQLQKKYKPQLDEKAHQYIDLATDGAVRMKQIILELLEYSRTGKEEGEQEFLDLNELLQDYKVLRAEKLKESSARIHYKKLPVIRSYKAPLVQIFHNIIDNAIKYRQPGLTPEIHIRAQEKAACWQVAIADNGIGIDSEYFDKIFVLFQRLHNRDEYEGTGMGLAIVKKNIDRLKGAIWLESELGKGSTFYFTIPKTG